MKTAARARMFPGIRAWGPETLQLKCLLSALKLAPGGETLTGRASNGGIDSDTSKPVTRYMDEEACYDMGSKGVVIYMYTYIILFFRP